jgi:glycosyltransferase involved in cell wall biosynthesis
MTQRRRCLILAEVCNPEMTSVPLEGWSHSVALSELHDAHVVTQVRNRAAINRDGRLAGRFTAIDTERVAGPLYRLANAVRGGAGKGWTLMTAFQWANYQYFEWEVWRQFSTRIRNGEFELVHRITSLSPTVPSPLAGWCRRAGVPFVIGPLNGGVPWPAGFDRTRRKEREWLSYVRSAHTLLPGYRGTRKHSNAIICGSRDTLDQMPVWCHERCVYIPENAIDPTRFPEPGPKPTPRPLRVSFVGRLVPYKGADMLIEAAAPLIRSGRLLLDIIGDGPEMPRLKELVSTMQLGDGVTLQGWVAHRELGKQLSSSHVFAFPSIREFGGAVVLEAMASGLVPIVVGYGGPAELVTSGTGFTVPIGPRHTIIDGFRNQLAALTNSPEIIAGISYRARQRATKLFSWRSKALQVSQVYEWVLGNTPKPDFRIPLPDKAPLHHAAQEERCPAAASNGETA